MDFIARDSPVYAGRLGTRIVESPRMLGEWPRSGSIVPDFDVDHIRELIVRAYPVIYVVRDEDCYTAAVVHGRRDLGRLFRQSDLEEISGAGDSPGLNGTAE